MCKSKGAINIKEHQTKSNGTQYAQGSRLKKKCSTWQYKQLFFVEEA
jgi:hypothetical protein